MSHKIKVCLSIWKKNIIFLGASDDESVEPSEFVYNGEHLNAVGVGTDKVYVENKTITDNKYDGHLYVNGNSAEAGIAFTAFELYPVPYVDFCDQDGNGFNSQQDTIDYINGLVSIASSTYPASNVGLTTSGDVGVDFTYKANYDRGVEYFWDETTFPTGITVSNFDRRILKINVGVAGTYTLGLEVVNFFATTYDNVVITIN